MTLSIQAKNLNFEHFKLTQLPKVTIMNAFIT